MSYKSEFEQNLVGQNYVLKGIVEDYEERFARLEELLKLEIKRTANLHFEIHQLRRQIEAYTKSEAA